MVHPARASLTLVSLVSAGLLATGLPMAGQATATDRVAPSPPQVRVHAKTPSGVSLAWRPARDNVGVTAYRVFRGGAPIAVLKASKRSYVVRGLACGTTYRLGLQATDGAGNSSRRSSLVAATAACGDQVIAAVGDLCLTGADCAPTAALVDQINPVRVLTLGDHAYPEGTLAQYQGAYEPAWGRFKAKTSPTPGNHDYDTPGARGYYEYFGARAPKEYFSFDLGAWHVISLNSEISVRAGSTQWKWLKADLTAHRSRCILAYWHTPHFSSGRQHRTGGRFVPFWTLLSDAGADVVLTAHEHNYERFARQDALGAANPKGVRQFVVGTGGAALLPLGPPVANSEARSNTTFGVLKLVLRTGGYDWAFVPVAGASFTDAGSDTC
ncbi:MAG TPA: metallophosphoesterase [Gaiella sp.]|jgi:hypothetical protein